jgi:S1-C subfamily serine protease
VYVTYYRNGKNYFKQINTTGNSNNIYYNVLTDTAFLKLNDSALNMSGLPYANSRAVDIGSACIVIGNPLSSDINSYSFGVVRDNNYVHSTTNNLYESLLLDASTYSGNSGGMILSLDGDNNIEIIGMLQYGFYHNALIVGASNIVKVPSENFGGGISASLLQFVMNTILTNGQEGAYLFPTLNLKTRPITNGWLLYYSALFNHNTQDGCYLSSSFPAISPNPIFNTNTVIEKINGLSVGAQLDGYNVLSILLESYYDNPDNQVTFTIINNSVESIYTYTVKDLFDTSGATQQNEKFIFDNDQHYLL